MGPSLMVVAELSVSVYSGTRTFQSRVLHPFSEIVVSGLSEGRSILWVSTLWLGSAVVCYIKSFFRLAQNISTHTYMSDMSDQPSSVQGIIDATMENVWQGLTLDKNLKLYIVLLFWNSTINVFTLTTESNKILKPFPLIDDLNYCKSLNFSLFTLKFKQPSITELRLKWFHQ